MKTIIRAAVLALAVLAFVWSPARAETADPPPILPDIAAVLDARELVGRFDLGFGAYGNCANGVCFTGRARPTAVLDAPASTACESVATARRFRPVVNTLRAVASWYPGKAFQTIRAARQTGRCR